MVSKSKTKAKTNKKKKTTTPKPPKIKEEPDSCFTCGRNHRKPISEFTKAEKECMKEKIHKVMSEFKRGKLVFARSRDNPNGYKVTTRAQALAIALYMARRECYLPDYKRKPRRKPTGKPTRKPGGKTNPKRTNNKRNNSKTKKKKEKKT